MTGLVVGIGASAGGLDAFRAFFTHMPPQSGMAFVLVQHLDPHHQSLLAELLGRHTEMPVVQAEDGMAVAPDQVFVIPPNAVLTIEDATLRVVTPAPSREQRRPIDMFFAALAKDQEEKAVAIVLSGSGSDGSLGLKAIKEHGGFTLAQAGYDETALLGMPSSAKATGFVDEVLAVERMPERLLAYGQHLSQVGELKAADGTRRDVAQHVRQICALLRARLGHDLSEYKQSTLIRRIQRRMQVLQINDVPTYIERLRSEPDQLDLLFRDMLIGVTHFFRDPEAFAALETEIIPKLVENKGGGDPIRIWVPGCATGEEAYSIAILLREASIRRDVVPGVQIFASDLDESAVAAARHGRYRKPLAGVSPERIERWFTEEGDEYSVAKHIREMCVYSTHNLIKDPPFARLDLISCRNLLIYLEAPLQARLLRTFHYALRPGGTLFLGASEGVARHDRLFAVLDKTHRIFRRLDDAKASLPAIPTAGTSGGPPGRVYPAPARPTRSEGDGIDLYARHALAKYSPAYVVIDRHHEVLRFSGRTGPYIEHSPGVANLDLFSILRSDLLSAVRVAVEEAMASKATVLREGLIVALNGDRKVVTLIVEPIAAEADAALFVVAFQEHGSVEQAGVPADGAEGADGHLEALEKELRATRLQLQATIDDLETANEELKSANEEYQSVNEEFQSTNEELESSKEELQSMNEELSTINGELNAKNQALTEANSDITNLLDSTEIATLFLDNDLRIRNFTPVTSEVFHLRIGDRGRPITEIVTRLADTDLQGDVRNVLRSLSMVEREVTAAPDGKTFQMRIRPYRTLADVIDGVVITFVDISERKRHEEERGLLAAIVDSSDGAIIAMELHGVITSWNKGAGQLFGYTAEEAVGQPIAMLYPPDWPDEPMAEMHRRVWQGERLDRYETQRRRKDGNLVDVSVILSPIRDSQGRITGASRIVQDITERKLAEELRDLLENELNHRVRNTLATVQSIAAQSLKGIGEADRETFDARLVALSQTHDLLARTGWQGASLRELVLQEIAPYRAGTGGRFAIDGPDLALRPKAVLALGLAFHELATNAAKYGALSVPEGQVQVSWEVQKASEPGRLRLRWAESGGPPVQTPQHKGFGSVLIERGLSLELDGTVDLDFASQGVVCTIEIPLAAASEKGVIDGP